MAEVGSHVLHATLARIAHHHREAHAAAERAARDNLPAQPPADAVTPQPAQEPSRGHK